MKRSIAVALLCIGAAAAAVAQTTIDKPAATIKLIRQEVISVRQLKADADRMEGAIGKKLTADQRRQLLEGKIDTLLFFQFCEREKILVSDAEVNAAIGKLKTQLGAGTDDAKLEIALRSQGILLDAKTYARQQLLMGNFLQAKKASDLKALKEPSADEVLKAYEFSKSQLVRPDTIRASVIFVDFRGLSADDKKKATDAIRQVAGQLKNNPSKFDEFLLKAGDQGAVYKATPSFYVEKTPQSISIYGSQFVDQVFKMKTGELSDIIENEAGLQIVRVNEVLPQKLLTLSDPIPGNPNATVQDYLKYQLMTQRQNEILAKIQSDLHDQLRSEGSVKVFEENLNF
jgi:parvulin-like peptidyl-prolyl isomerase